MFDITFKYNPEDELKEKNIVLENGPKEKKRKKGEDIKDGKELCCKCDGNLRGRRIRVQDCGHSLCSACSLEEVLNGRNACPRCGAEEYYSISKMIYFPTKDEEKTQKTNEEKEKAGHEAKEKSPKETIEGGTNDNMDTKNNILLDILKGTKNVNDKQSSERSDVNKTLGFKESPWYFILGDTEKPITEEEEKELNEGEKENPITELKIGLSKPLVPSPQLVELLGIEEGEKISAYECIKKTWVYIKQNKLQHYKDRYDDVGLIHPDKKMMPVFGNQPFKRIYLQRYIMKHLHN